MAVWCFNGEETTRKYGNRIDVEAEVAESIELNLRSEKEKNEAVVELYSLVNRYGGSIKEIREFPADLDGTGSFYMKPSDFGPEGRTVLRMDFPHGITILSLPVSGRELYVGLFKNGKYQGGNGDFSVHEIESNIRILNEG
ncbi:MAG: hypothetical protein UY92_C0006G0049 [Candidatus Magasanikbacteria bacterium GW2011_GWA2_56_11]|uniref:Uncharacterized protein n=1 Tax=Candidatus Magasanikbacteria bacterium GW2011_GWA2_56_11 TaxID=1619044 RepID=A0A0G1YGB9_9BACT|nr:MAG: hypothetical protein UY92_C0006G0049 [Candidatus Magasanikbacteria bacterium GW2011_GWA2_56_11]